MFGALSAHEHSGTPLMTLAMILHQHSEALSWKWLMKVNVSRRNDEQCTCVSILTLLLGQSIAGSEKLWCRMRSCKIS